MVLSYVTLCFSRFFCEVWFGYLRFFYCVLVDDVALLFFF